MHATTAWSHACWWPVWPLTLSLLGKSRRSLKWHQTSFEPVQCRWPVGDRRSQVTRIVKPEPVAPLGPREEPGSCPSPPSHDHDQASTVYRLLRLPFRPVCTNSLDFDPASFFHLDTLCQTVGTNASAWCESTLLRTRPKVSRISMNF